MTAHHRIQISSLLLAAVLAAHPTAWCADDEVPAKATAKVKLDSPNTYETIDICGWNVVINRQLLDTESSEYELGTRAQRLLRSHLLLISHHLPAAAVDRLRKITIWLEVFQEATECAAYHPHRDWLVEHGVHPDKVKCVEIANVRRYLEWSKMQPSMVLHELTHAYHDQYVEGGFRNPQIRAAWETAIEAGLYGEVLHANGKKRAAYAAGNEKEFFAELSEAFFGTNDFYPFVNAELKAHDPASYALLRSIWQIDSP